ncbi:hypothetical protein BH09BAC5_BH09BAC5_14220 [soil metagenome]
MKKIITTLLIILTIQSSRAQTFNPQLAAMLQDTLNFYLAAIPNIKGMSASVYLPGQGTWYGTEGVSYVGRPITKDMEFGIASNTKLFVATIMLKLQEDNLLSLDDSLHSWIPNYTNINPNITIRQLLNHTSGIQDPIFLNPWMDTINANPTRVFTPNEVLGWVGAPVFPAGTSWGYSNMNYVIAGMIAENATGFHISRLIRDSILTPLNMDSTFYDVEEADVNEIAHRWWNTIDYNDTSRVGLNTAGGAAGAIFSTSAEMAQWYHALFSGQILSPASMSELTAFVPTTSSVMDYGLGLDRETTLGNTYWGHGGTTWGYRSKMIYDTCLGAVVCGLTNSYPSGMEGPTFLLYRVVKNHVPGCSGAITGISTVCAGTQSVTYTVPPIQNATSYLWTLPSGATGVSVTNTITVDYALNAVSGNIIVSGVNNYGAGGTSILFITVNPIPTTPTISQNGNILSSSASSGNQWYNSSGVIPGATNQNYTVTSIDTYYCIVTLQGCSSDTSASVYVDPTGISLNENGSSIQLYPIPVTHSLTIENSNQHSLATVQLFNAFGEEVYNGELMNKQNIDMSSFANGIYLVRITENNSVTQRMILKQ